MSRVEDPRFIPDTLVWTEAETKRCDDLTAHNITVLARLQDDQLDRVLGGEIKIRRPWHSDDAVRRLAIDNMHPDDLAEILAAGLIGARVRVIRDSSDLGLDAGIEAEIIAIEGDRMDLSVAALDMTIAGVSVDHPDLEIISENSMARMIDDLARAYAGKYVADDGPRPATEESMHEVCRNCVRPPKPEIAQRAAELVNALQEVK